MLDQVVLFCGACLPQREVHKQALALLFPTSALFPTSQTSYLATFATHIVQLHAE